MSKRVVVVGGGIAGLAVAFELRERASRVPGGLEVQVLEGADRLGGNLRTERADGWRVEWGPNGFLDNVPATIDLVRRLGRESDLVRANPAAMRRFLYRNGKLHLLPSGAGSFLTCPVLSIGGRLRVLGEPFAKKHPGGDETIYAFAKRRIGREAAKILVDSMVSGVFAGDSRALSLAACFPKMAEMEREHGGLVRAMVAKMLAKGKAKQEMERRRDAGEDVSAMARPGGPAGPGGTLTSFTTGIETFVEALATPLGDAVHVGRPVRALDRSERRGWAVAAGKESVDADAVVLAIPSQQAAPLVAPLDDVVAATLREIPTSPLAVVALGYDLQAIGSAPNGFGFLVPRGQDLRILGCLCDSSIFPGRAPEGKVLVRAMIGGAHDPQAVGLADPELVGIASREVAKAMGFTAEPERHWVFRHRAGISQYTVGHLERLANVERRLASWPGLFLAGQSYRGVAMNSCAEQAPAVAEKVIASLH
jgi:oxygen-dependent protoporphyrinogen oxidase